MVIISSCRTTIRETTDSTPEDSTRVPNEQLTLQQRTVYNLLVWLKDHPDQADERSCFTMDGVDVTELDTLCLRQHLHELRATGLFATSYFTALEKEFGQMQAQIKEEGYAASKDYDRYFNSQDPPAFEETIDQLEAVGTTSLFGDEAFVSIPFLNPRYTLTYKLRKENGTWKISHIL